MGRSGFGKIRVGGCVPVEQPMRWEPWQALEKSSQPPWLEGSEQRREQRKVETERRESTFILRAMGSCWTV